MLIPLKEVLYNKKENGGLGLCNIYQKAKSIFVATIIRSFFLSEENSLIRHYMFKKLGSLFDVNFHPDNAANSCTPYYEYSVETIKKC